MKATAQIFLSYARLDERKVENLYQKLSDAGFKPWMDSKDILPGERWKYSIQRAIRRSDFFLVCLSANSVNRRGFLQKEIRAALDVWQEKLESDIYLIPVRLEDCEVTESLRDFQWVNLFEADGSTRLVKAIQVGMKRRGEAIKPIVYESTTFEPYLAPEKPSPGREMSTPKQGPEQASSPFGQPGIWYTEIPLSEFGQDVIVDLIKRVSKRDFEPGEYEAMSSSLLEITGGHPKGLVGIVTEDLDKRRGWTFGKRPGTRRFYFTPETNERLFKTYMTDVVNEVKDKIGEQWWEDFQTICILRKLNASTLKHLIDRGAIRQFTKGEELLGWLVRRDLVRERRPSMWGDAIARGVVVAEMKMIACNRERYANMNQMAADGFSESLDKICEVYETTPLSELESPLITYGIELMHHRLEEARYLPPEQRPENPLETALAEVRAKLVPLGYGIVQKFVEQVTQDKEICPSEEAKDMIANSFWKRYR